MTIIGLPLQPTRSAQRAWKKQETNGLLRRNRGVNSVALPSSLSFGQNLYVGYFQQPKISFNVTPSLAFAWPFHANIFRALSTCVDENDLVLDSIHEHVMHSHDFNEPLQRRLIPLSSLTASKIA